MMRGTSLLACSLVLVLLAGCRLDPPDNPDIASVIWKSYASSAGGYRVDHPSGWSVDEDAEGVRFRLDGYPVVSIAFVSEERARRRGLWAKREPVGDVTLAGLPGKRYVYDHHDALFSMRTVSYVVAHRDRNLGIEFRTERSAPDPVQQHILDSLRLE